MGSILNTIKKLLGISEEDVSFDTDIIIHINSVLSILKDIGVGPAEGFSIQDEQTIWDEFISEDENLSSVKTYIYLKVKLIFDPPASSVVVNAMEKTISELEWRLQVNVETKSENDENE